MISETTEYTKAGKAYIESKTKNQDFIYSEENDKAAFFAIADGVSSARKGEEGAEIACKEAAKILLDSPDYYFSINPKNTIGILINKLELKIKNEAKNNGLSEREYASTLVFLLCDKQSDLIMMFCLGDSRIYEVDNIAAGQVCETQKHSGNAVCTIVSNTAEEEAVLSIRKARSGETFLLCTDGMWKTAEQEGLFNDPEILLSPEKLKAYFDGREINDDCSYITVTLKTEKKINEQR